MKLTVTVDLGEVDDSDAWIALLTAFEHAAKVVEVQRNATAGTATLRGPNDVLEHRVEWRAATEFATDDRGRIQVDGDNLAVGCRTDFFDPESGPTFIMWSYNSVRGSTLQKRFDPAMIPVLVDALLQVQRQHEGVDNAADSR